MLITFILQFNKAGELTPMFLFNVNIFQKSAIFGIADILTPATKKNKLSVTDLMLSYKHW